MTTSYEDWEAAWEARQKYADEMNKRVRTQGVETVGIDAKDWIILRLMYQLYKTGSHAANPEVKRVVAWFNDQHPGYSQQVMFAAMARLAGEARLNNEQTYEPFWKEKGTWE